jgi:ribokinase
MAQKKIPQKHVVPKVVVRKRILEKSALESSSQKHNAVIGLQGAGFDIITMGSATVDVFAHTESELISIQSASHTESLLALPVGGKVIIEELIHTVGGGGTNTAVGFSRLGKKVGYVGCISLDSTDSNSDLILRTLMYENVAFLGHKTQTQSGYSVILNALNHDRTILTYKGANNDLVFSKLKQKELVAKWFYFSSMVGNAYLAEVKLARHAKKLGARVAFNPSSYHVKEGLAYLKPMLQLTDILVFNKEESELLCGTDEQKTIFSQLHSLGISCIVITDGAKAVYCSYKGVRYQAIPSKAKCVESTGAGDAFACGFVSGFMSDLPISDCLKYGMLESESVIGQVGAKAGLLQLKTLRSQLLKKKYVIKKLQ